MTDRKAQSISPVALVGLVAVVSLGSLGEAAVGGVWCYTTRGEQRTQPNGALMAGWLKGLSQAARRLHGHESTMVVAAKLCVHPQSVMSLDANPNLFVDVSDVPPPRSSILATLTNLPPPCV